MSDTTLIATVRKNQRAGPLDVRVWSEPYSGDEYVATKKGVCAKVKLLQALIAALREAEAETRRRGLIDD